MVSSKMPADFIALRDEYKQAAEVSPDGNEISLKGYKAGNALSGLLGKKYLQVSMPGQPREDGMPALSGAVAVRERGWSKGGAIDFMASEAACDKLYGYGVRPSWYTP